MHGHWDRMIPDRFFYPLAVLIVAALIGVALVWPLGQGAPTPRLPGQALPAAVLKPAVK